MRGHLLVGVTIVAFANSGAAQAATVNARAWNGPAPQQNVVAYDAAAGETNRLTVRRDENGGLRLRDDGAPLAVGSAAGGTVVCTATDAHEVRCVDLAGSAFSVRVEAALGDRDDQASVADVPATTRGGAGDDAIVGGTYAYGDAGNDTLTGVHGLVASGGAGDDAFHLSHHSGSADGGDGDDVAYKEDHGPPPSVFGCCVVSFDGGAGADRLVSATALKTTLSFVGGPGPDSVTPGPADFVIWDYSTEGRTSGVHVTQDGVADDGAPGERDNVPPALGSVVGTDAADDISESPAGGSITALGGNDTLHAWYPVFTWFGGNDGDDRIFVRDGARDSVFCAAGHDTVQADPVDQLDSGCESVNVH